jgi:hypothetical protein
MAKIKGVMSRSDFVAATSAHAPRSGPATEHAERQARETGKLNPLVDPAGFGLIRRSLFRFEKREDGLWVVAVGTPVPVEIRVDTTTSMGNEMDTALRRLPDTYDLLAKMLPECDPQIMVATFGDICDRIVGCRPQFEMDAVKIVQQITYEVPCRGGGDIPEDPQYFLFGAAYLTAKYLQRIGLKSYDITVSDAPGRDRLDESQLTRIFGKEVFAKAKDNGYPIDPNDLPSTKELVGDLLKHAHAFFLQVGQSPEATRFWSNIMGRDRVVHLVSTELLPQTLSTIVGLTEGTLTLDGVEDYLRTNNVDARTAKQIAGSVANIPIGAQAALPNFKKRPKKGDLFKSKTDLWPIDANELSEEPEARKKGKKGSGGSNEWL